MTDDKNSDPKPPPPNQIPTGSIGDSKPAAAPDVVDEIPTGNPGSTGPDIKVE